jgi:hypothetical protein
MNNESKIRMIYADVNASFINPTRNLVPALLRQVGDVRIFGPGYTTRAQLDRGLAAFVREEGPFDFLLTNTHILYADRSDAVPAGYEKSYALTCPREDLIALHDMYEALPSIRIPRVLLMFENDFYHTSHDAVERFNRNCDYVVGLGAELYPRLSELKNLSRESWGSRANDNWINFVEHNRARIISMPLYVGESEFSERQLAYREEIWAVLGSHYFARLAAIDSLKAANIPVDSRTPLFLLQLVRQRLRLLRRETIFLQRVINLLFWMKLQRARYAYTCGSGLEIPVRKFFEIPAAGSLMVCTPCKGFRELGFKSGINAISSKPEDLAVLHQELERDLARAQSIADAGQRLIAERHTVGARARDLKSAFARIMAGSFGGSEWRDGQFEIITG